MGASGDQVKKYNRCVAFLAVILANAYDNDLESSIDAFIAVLISLRLLSCQDESALRDDLARKIARHFSTFDQTVMQEMLAEAAQLANTMKLGAIQTNGMTKQ